MKIVSRISEQDSNLERLREIIFAATNGAIGEGGDLELAEDLTGLVDQVDITCASLMEAIDLCDQKMRDMGDDILALQGRMIMMEDALQDVRAAIEQGVEYDEDLDHATIDMMEALVASGASEPTFDGELSFTENIVISKEDFKPIVRQAIESWLRLKFR